MSKDGRLAGGALLVTATVHAWLAPEHLRQQPWLGVGFLLFAVVAAALAGLCLTRSAPWSWMGAVSAAAVAALLAGRVAGLPMHHHEVGTGHGAAVVVCLIVELLVIVLAARRSVRSARLRWTAAALALSVLLTGGAAAAAPGVSAPRAQHADAGSHQVTDVNHGGHTSTMGAAGLVLQAGDDSPTPPSGHCPSGAAPRSYDVVATAVDLPLNRYGDHDPVGRMYVLAQDLPRVRTQERAAADARRGSAAIPVTLGLQGDGIQPLALRVRPGECLRLSLRNDVADEPVALSLHGAGLRRDDTGEAAVPGRSDVDIAPGSTRAFVWSVPADQPEGTHYFHSTPSDRSLAREQTSHGLYGAVIVEPADSDWLDPLTLQPLQSGWAAVVTAPGRPAFREFALFYAEVGDETFQPLDRRDQSLPQAESLSGAYRPGARAINYRSEPFYDRLLLLQQRTGRLDDSLAYSSYAFGDPATPILRSYLGDPVTQRVVHAGSETAHVHHVHGGAVRWRKQPGEGATGETTGLDKHPPLLPGPSERVDAQTVGPSEAVDVHDECGAGGCQQSVGDFLVHCHVAHHYFAGMWGLWRVYNTLQDGAHSTDALPSLPALPDRTGTVRAGVSTSALGLAPEALRALLRRTLPPPGRPQGYDASVWDWTLAQDVALGEPGDPTSWPGHEGEPTTRRPILYDPITQKLAYPLLRPHLGKRPPFAPSHSPSPYLDPSYGPTLPAPGASGPASLCPTGTRLRPMGLRAIAVPVPLNRRTNLWDPQGQMFVLTQQEAAIRADPDLRRPLTIRANAGQDCLDLTLTNGLTDDGDPHGFSKVSLHVHFVQFDVQGSDGVDGGFNYEQTVRPFAHGPRLAAPLRAGSTTVRLTGLAAPGTLLGLGLDRPDGPEIVEVAAAGPAGVRLTAPVRLDHAIGEAAGPEFVRYRWYPDVQFGTAFFHDHVNAILGQPRGLYGSLVVEPPGSTYTDPQTGRPVETGAIADITTTAPTSVDVRGSFRELVTYLADDHPLTTVGRDTGGDLDLRVEPQRDRPDPTRPFAGPDPETAVLRARVGDPVVLRALVGASNEIHTLHLDGHTFRTEPWSASSAPVSTVALGISERADLSTTAGGPRAQPGNYLLGNGRLAKLQGGSWGVVRVLPPGSTQIRPLPGTPAQQPQPVCPRNARRVALHVAAVSRPLAMLGGKPGLVFAPTRTAEPHRPLVLHAAVGDCLQVTLDNATDRPLSLHGDQLAQAAASAAVGQHDAAAVASGAHGTVDMYADPSVGPTVALLRDGLDPVTTLRRGLYGAVVIHPKGSTWQVGADGVSAVVRAPDQRPRREFTVFLQDGDQAIGTHRMPYTKTVDGVASISYSAPSSGGPPLQAYAGDPVTLHVLAPASEQTQVFTVDGHSWPMEAGSPGTTHLSAVTLGGLQTLTLQLDGGAGGPDRLTGDYRYGNARLPYDVAGMTGVLQVMPAGQQSPGLAPLDTSNGRPAWWLLAIVVGTVTLAAVVGVRRRRR